MVSDPASDRGTLALTVTTVAAGVAGRTVEIVLVHLDTRRRAVFFCDGGRAANDHARGRIGVSASPGVIAAEEVAEDRAALVVTTCALAAGTGQTLSA